MASSEAQLVADLFHEGDFDSNITNCFLTTQLSAKYGRELDLEVVAANIVYHSIKHSASLDDETIEVDDERIVVVDDDTQCRWKRIVELLQSGDRQVIVVTNKPTDDFIELADKILACIVSI